MNWFLLGYFLKGVEDIGTTSPGGIPEFPTPKFIDRFVKKHNLYKDTWPVIVGLLIGLSPLIISFILIKIMNMF